MPSFLFLLIGLLLAGSALADERPELVVTRIFIGAASEIDDDFLENGGRDLAMKESERLVELLQALPQYRVHDSFFAEPSTELGSLDAAGDRVYVRGVVTRADVDRRKYFGDLELWQFTIGLNLEFFDIRSGQVYYNRGIVSRVPVETATEIDRAYRRERFAEAFRAGLDHLVMQCGKDYQPALLQTRVLQASAPDRVFVEGGADKGLRAGQVLQGAQGEERWLLKVLQVESAFSRLEVLASSKGSAPPAGLMLGLPGANRSAGGSGPSLAVSGVMTVDPEALDPAFDLDNATLGQWLHDGLAEQSGLDLLPPLLADAGGEAGELASAFFDAQAAFSTYGDVRQDEIIGSRPLPDRLARGVVTHALNRRSERLGFVANELVLGLTLEVYDRRSREVLATVSVEQSRLEKQNDSYRQADLLGAWRDLCRTALREGAKRLAAELPPAQRETSILVENGPWTADPGDLGAGRQLALYRPEEVIRDASGKDIGSWLRRYAVARTVASARGLELELLVDDGTAPRAGDVIRYSPRAGNRPLARLVSLEVGGPKVREGYAPNADMLQAWLQTELLASGLFRMLPPESQQAAFDAADVRLAGGEFELGHTDEVLNASFPDEQVRIRARLGLARVTTETGDFRNRLTFSTGLELSFEDAAGAPLQWLTGKEADRLRAVYNLEATQELDRGRIVQGVRPEEYDTQLDLCAQQACRALVEKLKQEAGKLP